MQYRETDFNFVSRLMEEEGIYYYFRHTDGHNTVVLTDSTGKHTATPGYEKIPFISPEQVVRPELEHISSWDFSREIQPGVYVHDDYDLERPSVELQDAEGAVAQLRAERLRGLRLSRALPAEGGRRAVRGGAHRRARQPVRDRAGGRPTPRASCVGSLFTLEDCPREDQNREHLILAASYDLEFSDYEAMPEGAGTELPVQLRRDVERAAVPAEAGHAEAVRAGAADGDGRRPGRRRDLHRQVRAREGAVPLGPATARRTRTARAGSACRSRGRARAGASVATPRIGQEVIVDFLEGDPDQPIITGRVYNAENLPPFGFPAGAVLSGIKSQHAQGRRATTSCRWTTRPARSGSSSTASTTWTPSSSTTRRRRSTTTGPTWSTSTTRKPSSGNQTQHVVKNQTINIDVNRTETVGGDETITITGHRIGNGERRRRRHGQRRAHAHGQRRADDDHRAGGGAHRRRQRERSPSARPRRSRSARRRW